MKTLITLLALTSLSQALTITGKASVDNKKVYTEIRNYNDIGPFLYESVYKDAKGKTFTTKTTHKSKLQWQPTFSINDKRLKESLSVRVEGKFVKSTFIDNGDTNKFIQEYKKDWVWDSGIHYWIVENWNKLSSSQNLTIYAPENDYVLPFKAIRETDKGLQKVTLTPQSWWLKLIFKEIQIWYDTQKDIVTYKGLSDIKDADGDNYITSIDYK